MDIKEVIKNNKRMRHIANRVSLAIGKKPKELTIEDIVFYLDSEHEYYRAKITALNYYRDELMEIEKYIDEIKEKFNKLHN